MELDCHFTYVSAAPMALQEVEAAKTMAPRGALLIGTAHGHSLSDLLRNNVLNPLVGGIREVTLGDVEAKASNKGHKVLPRAALLGHMTYCLCCQP